MTSVVHHRVTSSSKSTRKQPFDRHLSESGNCNGPICINAGIDSTCMKMTERIYRLENGIVKSSPSSSVSSPSSTTTTTTSIRMKGLNDDQLVVLSNGSNHDDQLETISNGCCAHCGK